MASMINDYKKIQRVLAFATRAAERCFFKVKITNVKCEYWDDEYSLELSFDIFEYDDVSSSASHTCATKCSIRFIEDLDKAINKIIKALEFEEKERQKDIKEYGEAFSESQAINISSALMFKQIIKCIKL